MAGTFFIMAFSVVPLILVIILTNGMTEGITRKYINLQTGNIQIRKYKANEYNDVSLPLIAEQLSGFEGAASSSIIYEGYGVIYSKNGSYTTMIRGVPTEFLKIPGIEEEIIEIHCNKFAGEFLIPDYDFEHRIHNLKVDEVSIEKLARVYSVSKEAVLRKLLIFKVISKQYYEEKRLHRARLSP